MPRMRFDDILLQVGEFGRYQKQQFFLLGMVIFSSGVQIMMTVFTLATPLHRCAVPGLLNDTYAIQSSDHMTLVSAHVPPGGDGCLRYVTTDDVIKRDVTVTMDDKEDKRRSQHGYGNDTYSENTTATIACDRWVFDDTDFSSTIVTQLQLVCDRKLTKSHVMMAVMLGQTIGCLLQGPASDLLGRKAVLMTSLVLHLVASVMTSWAGDELQLIVVFVVNGLVMAGTYVNAYTIGMELIGPGWRHAMGVAITGFWSLGMLWVCLLALLIPHWRTLQLAASGPIALFLTYFFIVPESARWLIYKGRYSEADVIMQRAAKVNHMTLTSLGTTRNVSGGGQVSLSVCNLFNYPKVILRSLVVFFIWCVSSLTYYGLGLNVGQLSGSIFLNFTLSAVFEIVAYVIVILALTKFGNRTIFCASLLLGAVACLATIVPVVYNLDLWLVSALSMLGKLGISGAFAMAWMFTSELFPTSLRASVTGFSSCSARLGGVAAAYIANMTVPGQVGVVLPQLVFGGLGLVAGLLALVLPETKLREMPETISDAATLPRKQCRKSQEMDAEKTHRSDALLQAQPESSPYPL